MWGKLDWTLILHLLFLYFLALFNPTPPSVSGVCGRAPFIFPFHFVQYPWSQDGTVGELSSSFLKLLKKMRHVCVLTRVGLTFSFKSSRGFRCSWVFFIVFGKINCGFWFSLRSFSFFLQAGYTFFCLDLDGFFFYFENQAAPLECLVVYSAVAAPDFGAGALIFVVSLAAAHRTGPYCFTVSFHCVSMSKTRLAASLYFIIFVSFSFCLFSRDFYESWWFFF